MKSNELKLIKEGAIFRIKTLLEVSKKVSKNQLSKEERLILKEFQQNLHLLNRGYCREMYLTAIINFGLFFIGIIAGIFLFELMLS